MLTCVLKRYLFVCPPFKRCGVRASALLARPVRRVTNWWSLRSPRVSICTEERVNVLGLNEPVGQQKKAAFYYLYSMSKIYEAADS